MRRLIPSLVLCSLVLAGPLPAGAVPKYARSVTLMLTDIPDAMNAAGQVSADLGAPAECALAGAKVKIQKRKHRRWRTIASTTTALNLYAVQVPDRQGKYRALAPRRELQAAICLRAVSPVVTHTHS